ncbi:MAG: RHS repeat-associated core domain-containing protein [Fimbriimonadaceae bacterium]|nr:RHS repeat-associated core domain-containing protein [Fimbriimonadaceae bacterium]
MTTRFRTAKFTPGISERRGTTSRFSHPDRMGSVTRQTSASQGSAASRQYDAFGNVAAVSGTWTGPFGFAGNWGYQEDGDSGLQLLGHRYYDPSTGRFLTRDPIKDGRNWYTYCENRPLAGVDPDGLDVLWIGATTGGSLAGHVIIGVEGPRGKPTFFGFWPDPDYRGQRPGKGGYQGRGDVRPDYPGSDWTMFQWSITPYQKRRIMQMMVESAILYEQGKGNGYNFETNNCAHWVRGILLQINVEFPNLIPVGSMPKPGLKSGRLKPIEYVRWLSGLTDTD